MKKFEIPHLASTIAWWLNYISAVGRNYIISESAIKIPASEYLERVDVENLELEYNHPKLAQKRFDLFFTEKRNKIDIAFEFKYVKEDSTRALSERKRIFYDLMRLYHFLDTNKKGYFLICGNQSHFKLSFENLDLMPKFPTPTTKSTGPILTVPSFYSEWFSFDEKNSIKTIDLNSIDPQYKDFYPAFDNKYSTAYFDKTKNTMVKPSSIKTKLIFLSEEMIASNIPQNIKIGIWEVTK